MPATLADATEAARRWLMGAMLPLWTSAGFDTGTDQFVEALTLAGEPVDAPRRTLVQARQMAVCCAGGRLGWDGPWAERAAAAGEALLANGRRADGAWVYSFGLDGRPADLRSDLYTQAFSIFGLAVAGRTLSRPDFVAAARDTAALLEVRWSDSGGGFVEGEMSAHPGRQNPHMHLLEAFLALQAATEAAEDLARAEAIGALFEARLFQPPGQAPEEFDARWGPLAAGGVAPGHQFEWAWLLGELAARGGVPRGAIVAALLRRGEQHGVDAAGFAIDLLDLDGRAAEPTARLWPQAERLRAQVSLRQGESGAAAQAAHSLMAYLNGLPGTWRDRRGADGGWRAEPAPASSAYHIVGALEALIRAAD